MKNKKKKSPLISESLKESIVLSGFLIRLYVVFSMTKEGKEFKKKNEMKFGDRVMDKYVLPPYKKGRLSKPFLKLNTKEAIIYLEEAIDYNDTERIKEIMEVNRSLGEKGNK